MAVTLPDVPYDKIVKHYEGDPDDLGPMSYVTAKMEHAVDRLASRFGTRILQRLSSGALSERLYESTIAEGVLRVVRNPDGYRTEQQGNYSYGVNAAVSSGYLWFTADNMADLLGESQSPIGTALIGDHRRT